MSASIVERVKGHWVELQSGAGFELALQAVLALNFADAVLTSWWVASGSATEANPLMNRVLELGIGPFLFTKVAIGMVSVLVLKAHRRHVLSRLGLAAILAAYAAVFAIHVSHGADRFRDGTLISSVDDVERAASNAVFDGR